MASTPSASAAFGHSSGVQLAALLRMEETRDNSDPVLAKYSSKSASRRRRQRAQRFHLLWRPEAVAFLDSFFGTIYSKNPEVWRDASPVFHVSKQHARFLIVHGTQDQEVAIAQSQELFDKLQFAGVPTSFIKIDDAHTFHTSKARRRLAVETLELFTRYLVTPQ